MYCRMAEEGSALCLSLSVRPQTSLKEREGFPAIACVPSAPSFIISTFLCLVFTVICNYFFANPLAYGLSLLLDCKSGVARAVVWCSIYDPARFLNEWLAE